MKELDPTESHCTQNNTDEIVRTDKIVVLTTQIIHFGGTMKYYKVCNTSFLGKKKVIGNHAVSEGGGFYRRQGKILSLENISYGNWKMH